MLLAPIWAVRTFIQAVLMKILEWPFVTIVRTVAGLAGRLQSKINSEQYAPQAARPACLEHPCLAQEAVNASQAGRLPAICGAMHCIHDTCLVPLLAAAACCSDACCFCCCCCHMLCAAVISAAAVAAAAAAAAAAVVAAAGSSSALSSSCMSLLRLRRGCKLRVSAQHSTP